jgi:hypothetical protein
MNVGAAVSVTHICVLKKVAIVIACNCESIVVSSSSRKVLLNVGLSFYTLILLEGC